MRAKIVQPKALVMATIVLASLSQAVAQESGTKISFKEESTSSGKPTGPGTWDPYNFDLVADRNESIPQFANISDAFKPGPGLTEESDEDQHDSSEVGSTDSLELVDNHDDDTWTEIGLYGFLVDISGPATIRNLTVDIDIPFSKILSHLELGGMAAVNHQRGKWSFILDVAYLKISADDTVGRNRFVPVPVELDAEFQQLLVEGFVGYRVFDRDYGANRLGIDVLGGARFNYIKVDVGRESGLLGLRSGSTDLSRPWTDGVIGLRAQFGQDHGWAVTGWGDIGAGPDSTSYQLMGLLSYKFENNIRVIAGYRLYSFDYERSSREIELDYHGPMIGVSYTF